MITYFYKHLFLPSTGMNLSKQLSSNIFNGTSELGALGIQGADDVSTLTLVDSESSMRWGVMVGY